MYAVAFSATAADDETETRHVGTEDTPSYSRKRHRDSDDDDEDEKVEEEEEAPRSRRRHKKKKRRKVNDDTSLPRRRRRVLRKSRGKPSVQYVCQSDSDDDSSSSASSASPPPPPVVAAQPASDNEAKQEQQPHERERFISNEFLQPNDIASMRAQSQAGVIDGDANEAIAAAGQADPGVVMESFPEYKPCRFPEDEWTYNAAYGNHNGDHPWYPWCPEWCFFCDSYITQSQIAQYTEYKLLKQMIETHFADMDMRTLCVKMQQAYSQHLQKYVPGNHEWSLTSIAAHIVRHAPTSYTITMLRLRHLNYMTNLLEFNGLCMRNTQDALDIITDKKNVNQYLELIKVEQTLIQRAEKLRQPQYF